MALSRQSSSFHTTVFCWGNNANGELGLGGIEDLHVSMPRHLQNFPRAEEVRDGCSGKNHTVLLLATGEVFTCGSNEHGQLGHSRSCTRFEQVTSLGAHVIKQVCSYGDHTLALNEAGQVFAWGSNAHGQLGFSTKDTSSSEPKMIKKLALAQVVQIACGNNHSLVLTLDGQVYSWGHNNWGQLGLGRMEMKVEVPSIVTALQGVPIAQIIAGGNHSFALSSSGCLFGWGRNSFGQLGINSDANSCPMPRTVFSLRSQNIKFVTCGEDHTAALTRDGGVFTFGASMYGQLGHGSRNNEILPRKVIELMGSTVSQLACGRCHTLAYVPHQSKVYAFGLGGNGQLGNGTLTSSTAPAVVTGPWSPNFSSDLNTAYHEKNFNPGHKRSRSDGKIQPHSNSFSTEAKAKPKSEAANNFNAENYYDVYKMITGGDQSFIIATNHKAAVSVLDFRHLSPETSVLHLSKDLVLGCTRQGEEVQDAITSLEIIFSSAACLNGSFLKSNDRHFNCSITNIGLDFSEAFSSFSILEEYNSTLSEMIQSSMELQLFPSLQAKPPDMEALRLYVLLPFCHLFHKTEANLKSLIIPFAKALLALIPQHSKVIELWWRGLEVSHFMNLIQIFKKCLSLLLSGQWDPMDFERHRYLRVSLEFLARLNRVNQENSGIVPFQEFYIEEISEKIDVSMDYTKWIMAGASTRDILTSSSLYFCDYPFVFDAHAKTIILQTDSSLRMKQAMEEAQAQNFTGLFLMGAPFTINPFLVINVSRENIVQDTISQLCEQSPKSLKKPLKVVFIGEEAVDAGGVTKEFFLLLLTEILDPKFGMFTEFQETRCIWFNPKSFEEDLMFYIIGILCGLAIYNFTIINLPFPLVLYKKLLNEQLQLEDLKDLSPRMAKSFQELLLYEGDDFEDVFMLTFEVSSETYGHSIMVPLKDGGDKIPVTLDNRKEYVDLYVDYMLNRSVSVPYTAFTSGFHKVCEGKVLKLFHAQELMSLVIGSTEYDWDELERNCEYKNEYHKNHPTIRMFWSVFQKLLTQEEKKKFLLFLTGSDRIPILGMKSLKMTIQPMHVSDAYLPAAHTCFNILDLPPYSNPPILHQRLLQVIQHTQGFGLV